MAAQKPRPKRMALTWVVIGATVLIFVTATLLTVLLGNKSKRYSPIVLCHFSRLLSIGASSHRTEAYSPSVLGHFSNAAVAVDGRPCAQIAK